MTQIIPTNMQRQKSGPSEVSLVIKYLLFALNVLFWVSTHFKSFYSINTNSNKKIVKYST